MVKGLGTHLSVPDISVPMVWFHFKHEAKKFLVRFSFENDGFAVETIIKKDFIWCKCSEAFVTKDETVVDISDVADE